MLGSNVQPKVTQKWAHMHTCARALARPCPPASTRLLTPMLTRPLAHLAACLRAHPPTPRSRGGQGLCRASARAHIQGRANWLPSGCKANGPGVIQIEASRDLVPAPAFHMPEHGKEGMPTSQCTHIHTDFAQGNRDQCILGHTLIALTHAGHSQPQVSCYT